MYTADFIEEILTDESLDIRVTELLSAMGVHAGLSGYRYLRAAVMLASRDLYLVRYPTKTLYPEIAKYFGTDSESVERNCRRAVDNVYLSKRSKRMSEFFTEHGVTGKPTCKEFILTVACFVGKEY